MSEQQSEDPKLCRKCREFFSRFRCAATTHLECDCPKCQGYCECGEELDGNGETLRPDSIYGPGAGW